MVIKDTDSVNIQIIKVFEYMSKFIGHILHHKLYGDFSKIDDV